MSSLLRGGEAQAQGRNVPPTAGRNRTSAQPERATSRPDGPPGVQQLADSDPTLSVLLAHTRAHPCVDCPALGRDLVRAAGRTAKPAEAPGTKKEPVPPRREATPARQTASGRAGRMPAVGKLLVGGAPLDLDELFRPVSQDVGLLDKIVSLVEVFREIGLHP